MKFLQPFEAPIWIAMIGFLFSIALLTKPGCNRSNSAFTEIKLTGKREVVDDLLLNRVKRLDSIRTVLEADIQKNNCIGEADTGKICKAKKELLKPVLA